MRARSVTLVIVDLSSLCRDDRFRNPSTDADLRLYDAFVAALIYVILGHATVCVVADRSLRRILSRGQVRQARSMEQAGSLGFIAAADERILDVRGRPQRSAEDPRVRRWPHEFRRPPVDRRGARRLGRRQPVSALIDRALDAAAPDNVTVAVLDLDGEPVLVDG